MVCIVLKAGVDKAIMWRYKTVFIATMKINSISVEEQSISNIVTNIRFSELKEGCSTE